jgi:hypothetical protein
VITYRVEIMAEPIYLAQTYAEAVAMVQQHLPGCELGHPGDITDGGTRTLVWATESDAEGDDGAQAVAVIVRRGEVAL